MGAVGLGLTEEGVTPDQVDLFVSAERTLALAWGVVFACVIGFGSLVPLLLSRRGRYLGAPSGLTRVCKYLTFFFLAVGWALVPDTVGTELRKDWALSVEVCGSPPDASKCEAAPSSLRGTESAAGQVVRVRLGFSNLPVYRSASVPN